MKLISKFLAKFKKQTPKVEDFFVKQEFLPIKINSVDGVCMESCGDTFFCDICGTIKNCNWIQKLENFDPKKQTILLIDDNPGVVSFLRDDIETIFKRNDIDPDTYNILEFTSNNAVYKFIATHQFYGDLNITKAIIDITYGGSVQTNNGNIRLTGVDVFKLLQKSKNNFKFIFYTGNQLNPYIKSNKLIMDEFKDLYHENIIEHVLYKTSMNMDERIHFFEKRLFDL